MATETTTTLSNNLPTEYFNRQLLSVLDHELHFVPLGIAKPLPPNNGTVAQWIRYSVLAADTDTLTEGVVPSEESLTTEQVSATISQYGNFVKIADLLDMTAIDPVAKSAVARLGRQAALTLDTLCRNELTSTLQEQFANDKADLASTGSNDVCTSKELLKARITLRSTRVGPHETGKYVAVLSPESVGDIMNDTNVGSWVDLNKYTGDNSRKPLNGEIGMVFGTRILESDNISSTTTGTLGSAEVFSNIVMGQECLGVISLDKQNVRTYVKSAGSAGTADPLDQISTVGYKVMGFAAKHLGEGTTTNDRGVTVRCGSAY